MVAVSTIPVRAQTWDSLLAEANAAKRTQGVEAAHLLGQRALDLAREANGEVDSSVALVLHRMGVFHHSEPFDTALDYYLRAMEVWEELEPRNPLNEAKTLNNLGSIYNDLGKYELAVDYYNRALNLKKPLLDENDNSLARAYRNLGDVLSNLGRYVEAEECLMHALRIRETTLPAGHPDIASTENLLGILFQHRNQYDKAEYWYSRAIATGAFHNGHAPPGFANNLGLVWLDRGKYKQAESLYIAILADTASAEALIGLNRALVWNNLGLAHQMLKRHREAVIEFDSALQITRALLGAEHPEYARRLCNKGKSIGRLGNFREAESMLLESLHLREKYLSDFQPDICHSLRALGWLYRGVGRNREAFDYFSREQRIYRRLIHWFIPQMTQRDALTYAAYLQSSSEQCLAALRDIRGADPLWVDSMTAALVYDVKGVVSEELATRQLQSADTTNPGHAQILRDFSDVQAQTFALLTGSQSWTAADRKKFDSLTIRGQELEGMIISERGPVGRNSVASIRIEQIASRLPKHAALIEYFVYTDSDSSRQSSVPRYLAIVVKPDSSSNVYDLGPATQANKLIADYREHFRGIDIGGVFPGKSHMAAYDSIAAGLYAYFVEPFAGQLTDIDRLFVAPDGDVNFLSLSSLKDTEGTYLVERWAIQYLSSGRDLMQDSDARITGSGLIAIGDPDFEYDKDAVKTGQVTDPGSNFFPTFALRGDDFGVRDGSLPALPGTRREIQQIVHRWENVTSEPAQMLLGKDASEPAFREKLPGHRVIYIATHGFLEDDSLAARLPYLHCGLYLSGANRAMEDHSYNPNEDGIITAQDILLMDLAGVDLVVLSACESGLGEVSNGEGVFGLRRAFRIAGSRSVISSLWHIPDALTANMMASLFARSEEPLMERLRDLQLRQLERLRHDCLADHPFSWAAFIASGDWR